MSLGGKLRGVAKVIMPILCFKLKGFFRYLALISVPCHLPCGIVSALQISKHCIFLGDFVCIIQGMLVSINQFSS